MKDDQAQSAARICCTSCGEPYPKTGLPHQCPECGGFYDYMQPLSYSTAGIDVGRSGMWKYRRTFGLSDPEMVLDLGEGDTPLIWDEFKGVKIGFKMEALNPTGSYKDRGSAVLAGEMVARGISEAVEDSSGNAGASFAAYAAMAGIRARVYVPESASGPKRVQIERYGAELIRIPGPRSESANAVLAEAKKGIAYASHAFQPFGLPGIATIAYELSEQCAGCPGTIIAPAGHGGLLLGIIRGFDALKNNDASFLPPFFAGVQAKACAPMWQAFEQGITETGLYSEGQTIAEGVRVNKPSRAKAILERLKSLKGKIIAIEEERILPAVQYLWKKGLYVEPTSALAWCALEDLVGKVPEPIILIMTGSGLKYYPSQ